MATDCPSSVPKMPRPGVRLPSWASDEGFRQIVESAHEGVWMLDEEGNTTYVNRQMGALLGYTPEEMLGRNAFEFVWPEDLERGTRDWQARRAASEGQQGEYRYRHKDGHPVWCLANTSLIHDTAGRPAGVLGMFTDISRRKQAEQALRESEERYRGLFDSMSEGFVVGRVIYGEDGRACDYRLVEANRAYERLTGLPREESLRQTMKQLIPTLEPVWVERHARVAETGRPERWEAYNEQVGQHYEMYSFSPGPGLFASVFVNVTERKRHEEALRESEEAARRQSELLSGIIDNIPVLLAIWDPELRSFRFNRRFREVLGWTEEDAAGGDFMALAYPDTAYRREVSEYMLSLAPGWRDIATTAKSGEVLDVSWANIRLPDGRFIGIGIDVRERKAMEAELQRQAEMLRESDRRKDEFIAILSHELRNPLAPIRYALPLLEREDLGDTAARALAVIGRQVNHLTRLVDDLLDVSRITRGKIDLRPEYITLASVVTASVEAASPAIAAGSHTLRLEVAGDPIWLRADPARMAQIVTNLLDNSAKYTERGGTIVLEAGRDGGHAVIRVRDNGAGISPQAMPTIFEMFRQVSRPDGQGGLGIGLSLVRRLVEMHGGEIEARSAGAGQGAEFVVRVPVAEEVQADGAEPAGNPREGGRRLRVLVVDDNEDLAEMLAMLVEGAGHEVRKAFDGPAGVSAALAFRPHVVLLDLGLPGMSGIDVAAELRRQPATAGARLIALTGWGQEEDRRKTGAAGFDHHLTKPADPDHLEALLAEISSHRRRRDDRV